MGPLALIAWLISVWGSAGCANHEDCSCFGAIGGIIVHAMPGAVVSIAGSGEACSDTQLRCIPDEFSAAFRSGCTEYQIYPRRAGACSLDVTLADGTTVKRTTDVVITSGCCGGPTTSDPAAAEWALGPDSTVQQDAAAPMAADASRDLADATTDGL